MSIREIEPLIRSFVTSLVELAEANAAHGLQTAIASELFNRSAAQKRKVTRAAIEPLPVGRSVRRAPTATPKMIQARKVQGQYMAAVRGLKLADRSRVKKLTSEKGAVAGLALARLLGQRPKLLRKAGSAIPVVKSSGNVGSTPHSPEIIR